MEETKNMNLNLPGDDDFFNVEHFNQNFRILDAQAALVLDMGSKADLATMNKENVVNAVNELKVEVDKTKKSVGNTETLATTSKTSVVAAVNELNVEVGESKKSIGNKEELTTSDKDSVVKAVNELNTGLDTVKKSVGNGKSLVAASITRKKINTAAGDSFEVMAGNIDKIKLGSGNATTDKVLAGTTFTNDSGVEQTGTMSNENGQGKWWAGYETVTVQPVQGDPDNQGAVTVPNIYCGSGCYTSSSSVTGNVYNLSPRNIKDGVLVGRIGGNETNCIRGSFTSDGTITSDKVLSGSRGYAKGQIVDGTMPNFRGSNQPAGSHWSDGGNVYFNPIHGGYYSDSGTSGIYRSFADLGITSDKIVSGQSICGITGTGGDYKYLQIECNCTCSAVNLKNGTWKNLFATSSDIWATFKFPHGVGRIPQNAKGYFGVGGNFSSTNESYSGENFRIGRGYEANSLTTIHYFINRLPFAFSNHYPSYLSTTALSNTYSIMDYPGTIEFDSMDVILKLNSENQSGNRGAWIETRADSFKAYGYFFYQ